MKKKIKKATEKAKTQFDYEDGFKKTSEIYLGSRLEDDNPSSDWGQMRRLYYFEKNTYWETKLMKFASRYFRRGDNVYFVNSGSFEYIEVEKLIFRRSGNKFTVQVKETLRVYDVKSFLGDLGGVDEINVYKRYESKKAEVSTLYKKARSSYDYNVDKTGYWHIIFNDKTKMESFCMLMKKEARKNKAILNYYKPVLMNLDRQYIVKIYCLDEFKMEVRESIRRAGIETLIEYTLSRRSVLMSRERILA